MLAVASLVSCESERESERERERERLLQARDRTKNVLPINCRNSTERQRQARSPSGEIIPGFDSMETLQCY